MLHCRFGGIIRPHGMVYGFSDHIRVASLGATAELASDRLIVQVCADIDVKMEKPALFMVAAVGAEPAMAD